MSVGNTVPSLLPLAPALEWYNASKIQIVSNEEWYFTFAATPIQYLMISTGGTGIEIRKIAAFGVDYCSAATSVSTTIVTAYASIPYVIGTTISIPWPTWTVIP